jgi:oxalate decarboxylase/phosphoglucose isomerase-like protein (cupin superfamily)
LDLEPWPRIGGKAVFINLYSFMEAGNGVYVAEIPPGGKLEPERWCCQKIILVEGGTGATEIWQEGDTKTRVFEWGKGSVFAIPINARHRMYNLGSEPAKFLALTKAPLVMKGFGSAQFVFNCSHPLRELYSVDDEQYFTESRNRQANGNARIWETNFIRDAWGAELDDSSKAYGGTLSGFRMANKTFGGHVAEWPVGRYHQAHYHDSGRLVHPLRSEGFVMLWSRHLGQHPFQDGHADEVVIEPFKPGGLYSPPGDWYHAHFNTGTEPARHLAFYGRSGFEELTPGRAEIAQDSLIGYTHEDPEVRRLYKEVLGKKGIPFDMPESLFELSEALAAGRH